jgi:phage shock protein A
MFDLNAIVSAALNAAVAEAIKPLVEQIAVLEQRIATLSSQDVAMGGRIDALETKLTEVKLFEQTTHVQTLMSPEMIVDSMNNAEWLWE